METPKQPAPLLPTALLDEVEAAAAMEDRPVREMLREAVERYLQARCPPAQARASRPALSTRTPGEAATRMLERRRFHPLPETMNIHDLLTYGRA